MKWTGFVALAFLCSRKQRFGTRILDALSSNDVERGIGMKRTDFLAQQKEAQSRAFTSSPTKVEQDLLHLFFVLSCGWFAEGQLLPESHMVGVNDPSPLNNTLKKILPV